MGPVLEAAAPGCRPGAVTVDRKDIAAAELCPVDKASNIVDGVPYSLRAAGSAKDSSRHRSPASRSRGWVFGGRCRKGTIRGFWSPLENIWPAAIISEAVSRGKVSGWMLQSDS